MYVRVEVFLTSLAIYSFARQAKTHCFAVDKKNLVRGVRVTTFVLLTVALQ